MLVEIHMLQNHSPSNLNRDDLGAPKTAMFGGTLRARISSQCLKRSIRRSPLFMDPLKGFLGTRTVSFPERVREALGESAIPKEHHDQIVVACTQIAQAEPSRRAARKKETAGEDEFGARTAQLIFLAPNEAGEFVARLERLMHTMPKDYKKFLKTTEAGSEQAAAKKKPTGKGPSKPFWEELRESYQHNAVDIALFGRMTTSDAFEDVEATMQTAHALSTNDLTPEVDYFTAVDDLPGRAGAAYLEQGQFNSATFYKYFSVDWNALVKELGDAALAAKTVETFIHAAACTVPTGKRNSFGNSNLPDGILVELKERTIPTNYANAFLVPARPYSDSAGAHDIMEDSIRKLSHYVQTVVKGYGIQGKRWWFSTRTELPFEGADRAQTLPDMVNAVMQALQAKEHCHGNP